MIIGLTGAYCAGKNAVAAILETKGWACIDVDKLGHEAMALARGAIVDRFGPRVVAKDGNLDRRALARIVFSDPAALADQEAIVHPVAIRLMDEKIAEAQSAARRAGIEPKICVNAALLHRAGHLESYAAIVEVRAPLALRIRRGLKRDGASLPELLRRIARQRGFRRALLAALGELDEASRPPLLAMRNGASMSSLEARIDRFLTKNEKLRL